MTDAAKPLPDESVGIKSMHVENGKVEVETVPAPEAVAFYVESFRELLDGADAPNYVQMEVKMAGEVNRYVVTIQRHEGKTPHELRQQAELVEMSLRTALEAIAKGKPKDIPYREWGDWCEQWAKDELNAADVLRAS